MTDTRRRVKLYELNAERQWDDKGTGELLQKSPTLKKSNSSQDLSLKNICSGHVSSTYVERLKGISLVVRSEVVTDPPHKTLSLSYIVYFLMIVGGLDVNLYGKTNPPHLISNIFDDTLADPVLT